MGIEVRALPLIQVYDMNEALVFYRDELWGASWSPELPARWTSPEGRLRRLVLRFGLWLSPTSCSTPPMTKASGRRRASSSRQAAADDLGLYFAWRTSPQPRLAAVHADLDVVEPRTAPYGMRQTGYAIPTATELASRLRVQS